MMTNGELGKKNLPLMLEYHKNMTKLLEHPMWKGLQLSAGKKDKTSKVRKVDDEVDALEVHASSHAEDMCNKDDHTTHLSTPLEFSNEGKDTNTYDGQFSSRSDHEEEITSSPHDDSGVDTPRSNGALTHDDSPLEKGLTLQDMHMGDDQSSAVDVGDYVDEGSTCDPRSSISELVWKPGRDVGSYGSHYLEGKLKAREDMIVASMRHLDDTHALVADYCWRATVTHDGLGGEFSTMDFQILREAVAVMRSNYQHILMDRYYLLAIGEMYHGALKEKEDEVVDRFSYELVSTQDSLKSAQRDLQESESWVEQLREELSQVSLPPTPEDDQSYISSLSLEDISDRDNLMEEIHELEEPQMMGEHEECLDSQVVSGGTDAKVIDAQEFQEPLPLESSLATHDETFEYPLTNNGDSADGDTFIQCPKLVDTHGLNDTVLQLRHRVTSRGYRIYHIYSGRQYSQSQDVTRRHSG
jgi:hypothetical protein